MRFVSKYGRFGVQIRPEKTEPFATGEVRVLQTPVYAMFEPGGLQPLERELALAHWTFNGIYQEQDEVTMVPPDYRIGVFDSELAQLESGWTDEIRIQVEEELTRLAESFEDLIAIPRTLVPPPWPRYDDFKGTTNELIQRLIDDGHDLDAVLTYERATQKREDVIAAIETLVADPDALLELQGEEILG